MKHMIFHNLRMLFIEERLQVELLTPDKGRVLRGEIGIGIAAKLSRTIEHTDSLFSVVWAGFGKLSISREFDRDAKVDRYDFRWELDKESGTLKDAYDLDGAHWYGAAQVSYRFTWIGTMVVRQTPGGGSAGRVVIVVVVVVFPEAASSSSFISSSAAAAAVEEAQHTVCV